MPAGRRKGSTTKAAKKPTKKRTRKCAACIDRTRKLNVARLREKTLVWQLAAATSALSQLVARSSGTSNRGFLTSADHLAFLAAHMNARTILQSLREGDTREDRRRAEIEQDMKKRIANKMTQAFGPLPNRAILDAVTGPAEQPEASDNTDDGRNNEPS